MKTYTLLLCCLFNLVLQAQDTVAFVHEIPAIDIKADIRVIQHGTRQDIPDSSVARMYPAGTLSDLLGTGGAVALKSIGPGALATVSIRGANSMQTPVLWNGVNLQNINNNTVDLSLLPVFVFDQVSVEPGSSAATWGNGAIGGAIRANTGLLPVYNGHVVQGNYWRFRTVNEVGSFGTLMNGVQVGFGLNLFNGDVRAYRQTAENHYPFTNIALIGSPRDTLKHAHTFQQGIVTGVGYHTRNLKHSFVLRTWVQETSREIAPTMLQTVNEAVQRDYALRTTLQHGYVNGNFALSSKFAVIHEGLLWDAGYNTPLSNTDAWSLIADVNATQRFGSTGKALTNRSNIMIGVTGNRGTSEVAGFIAYHEQFRAGVYAAYGKFLRKSDEFNITLREEIVDGRAVEPVGSLWYSFVIKDKISIKPCVSHNYRIPTFNDLYWMPGGNPDLKAETGWTEELTLETVLNKEKWSLKYAVTAYNRNVVNMITWVPYAAYWSPVNVAEVWSRGVEHRLRLACSFPSDMRAIFTVNVDYVRSTYEKSGDANDATLGNQLIYVPAWFGAANLTFEWKDFFFTFSHQYTDHRFATRDHREWIPAYWLSNAAAGWNLQKKDHTHFYEVRLFIRCNNIADVEYQSIPWRPMPGRNFTLGLVIDFCKITNNQTNQKQ